MNKICTTIEQSKKLADILPHNDSIEYTLIDNLIENAWDWIEDNVLSSNQQDKSLLYYEQFKKYLYLAIK